MLTSGVMSKIVPKRPEAKQYYLFGFLALARSAVHYTALNARFVTGGPAYEQALHALTWSLAQHGAAQPSAMAAASLAQGLGQQATLLAGLDYFAVVASIGLAGAVLMLAQRVLK